MKKNLISVIILALLIVNIILTAIMMFSVTSASKKTAALVDNISTALNLELTAKNGDDAKVVVPMENIETYNIADSMTIPLKQGEDGTDHYCVVSIGFSINTKDKAYKTYTSDLSPQETMIKDKINTVFAQYTIEEARGNEEVIKAEILKGIQEMFDSEFIFDVSFSSIIYS